jgi:predicted TIM-barrel fold metal-dependent hydrolase
MHDVIDADTHIAESQAMWSRIDRKMYDRRPILVSIPADTWYKEHNAFWLIDGNMFPKPAGRGGFRLVTPSSSQRQAARTDIPISSRELTDLTGRIADMDKLEVQTQVIYPTLFLVYLTDDLALEIALCHAYNSWLADVSSKTDRIKWVAILPLRSVDDSLKEMKWCKDRGAVGLFFRGIERDLTLDRPNLFPIYKQAAQLDLAICIHTGSGAPSMMQIFDLERNHTFAHSRILPMIAFRDIVANKIPELFPGLRFGFLEASAGWVPYLLHVLRRQMAQKWQFSRTEDLFREYRLFVACEADEDIHYLMQYMGQDNLIMGSDYGHPDPSEELQLVKVMQSNKTLPGQIIKQILCDNPKRFYAL